MTDEQLGPMKLIFNYNDVFYSFFYDDLSGCIHRSREYAINYVYSGEMILDNGTEQIHVGKGECVFIPRDHHITMYKKTKDGERYCGIFLMFTRRFLREMYGKLEQRKVPVNTPKLDSGVIKLPKTVELASLFASMTPLLRSGSETQRRFHELEIAGGVACVAAYRQAVRSDALRLQRTVEDRHHGIYERELHVRVHDGRNGALHRTQPCHVQAGFQENQRPDTRKMAYPKTARSGLCQNERGR